MTSNGLLSVSSFSCFPEEEPFAHIFYFSKKKRLNFESEETPPTMNENCNANMRYWKRIEEMTPTIMGLQSDVVENLDDLWRVMGFSEHQAKVNFDMI